MHHKNMLCQFDFYKQRNTEHNHNHSQAFDERVEDGNQATLRVTGNPFSFPLPIKPFFCIMVKLSFRGGKDDERQHIPRRQFDADLH